MAMSEHPNVFASVEPDIVTAWLANPATVIVQEIVSAWRVAGFADAVRVCKTADEKFQIMAAGIGGRLDAIEDFTRLFEEAENHVKTSR